MKRKSSCENQDGVNKGPWSAEEDKILINYVQLHGEGKWRELSKRAGIESPRCSRNSCFIGCPEAVNDSVNTMSLIPPSWDNQNPFAYIPQDDNDHYLRSVLQDFDITDMLVSYEDDCRFGRYACVEIPQHFGDEAYMINDAIGETWYENWKIDA
uniref:Myb-related protein Myb4 n=1 Tax=Cajanus cajan TaxID=3821 RepID=A0A151SE84_CAJCA|nr:Myb-related protein Myb4 [Cajanus cajan]